MWAHSWSPLLSSQRTSSGRRVMVKFGSRLHSLHQQLRYTTCRWDQEEVVWGLQFVGNGQWMSCAQTFLLRGFRWDRFLLFFVFKYSNRKEFNTLICPSLKCVFHFFFLNDLFKVSWLFFDNFWQMVHWHWKTEKQNCWKNCCNINEVTVYTFGAPCFYASQFFNFKNRFSLFLLRPLIDHLCFTLKQKHRGDTFRMNVYATVGGIKISKSGGPGFECLFFFFAKKIFFRSYSETKIETFKTNSKLSMVRISMAVFPKTIWNVNNRLQF